MEDWWLTLRDDFLGWANIQKFMVEFNIFYLLLNHKGPTQTVTISCFFEILEMSGNSKTPLNYHELLFFVVFAASGVEC